MIRRTAIATVPVVVALGVALAGPAVAAGGHHPVPGASVRAKARAHPHDVAPYGSCSLVVPAAVRVVRPGTAVPVRVTGGCALQAESTTIAGWYIGTPDEPVDYIAFDNTNRTYWKVYSFTPLGTRTWKGDVAFDSAGDTEKDYTQNSPRTTVKVGSWAGLSTSRTGNKVSLSTRIVRYSTARDENIAWAGESGVIQYRAAGSENWTSLKNITTSARGTASYTYTPSSARDYRVVYGEAAYVWGATSPTSHR